MSVESIIYKYKSAYYNFPQPLKTFLGSLYGNVPLSLRFGEPYRIHKNVIKKFEDGDEQFKLDYMYNKTLETLLFAENNIIYYKNIFHEYGISSQSFKELNDIKLFPNLTKAIIKENLENIYTDSFEKPVEYYSGGSLSTPTKFFLPASSRGKEKAYNQYVFSQLGYKNRDKTLLLKGREIANIENNTFCEYEPVANYFLLSNNYMNSNKFPKMYHEAKKFQAKFIFGYPSAVLSFIKQSKKHGFDKLDVKGIILASETVYPNEIREIQDYFGVEILTHYGHTERNAMAYRMNDNNYNFMNSYGLVRDVDNQIVTTTFDNFVMPFINYETTDILNGKRDYFEQTDVVKRSESIEGRMQDFLVTKDKRLVSITTMCGGQFLPLEQISTLQYIQEEPGEVTVLVEGNNADKDKVISGMKKLVRDGIDFKVKNVDSVEKSSRGKRIMCKQSLNIEKIRMSNDS